MIIPVILSGGAGTRLWPVSRELEPKHLVDLLGTTTLLQKTVARLEGLPDAGAPVVVGGHAHYQLVIDQLAEVGVRPTAMLLEPIGRNTAPAAAVAAMAATGMATIRSCWSCRPTTSSPTSRDSTQPLRPDDQLQQTGTW